MGEYQKEFGFEKYEIEDYEEGRFERTASLHIGQKIKSALGCFLFSGTMADEKTGITVAHGFNDVEEEVFVTPHSAANLADEIIGKCREKIHWLQSCNTTADMAVIELEPDFNVRKNTVPVPWLRREIRIKIYSGESIPDNKRVMILNQDGRYRFGAIRRYSFSDRLADEGYHNVLAVSSEDYLKEVAITRIGDSGALVMSIPEVNSDVVFVYGIVIALYNKEDKDTSLTIANNLSDVVNDDSFRQQLRETGDIDFTWKDLAL